MKAEIMTLMADMELTWDEIAPLYESYLDEVRENISEMIQYVQDKDAVRTAALAHAIKGVSANLRVEMVRSAASELNEAAKFSRTELFEHLYLELQHSYQQASGEVRQMFSDNGVVLGE